MTIWAHPRAESWVAGLMERGVSLYRGAEEGALPLPGGPLRGRGTVHVVSGAQEGERWAVRHFRRGGLLAPITGDRYFRGWGLPRPFAEAAASEVCRARGIPTPQVMAAAVYGRGPLYRGDLVTRYVPGTVTLARFLVEKEGGGRECLRALELAGRLTRSLAERGVLHPDLNVKNILLDAGADPAQGYVLDLDRVQLSRGVSVEGDGMYQRLARSLRKWERLSGLTLPPEGWAALESGWTEGDQR